MSLYIHRLGLMMAPTLVPVSYTYIDTYISGADQTTYTFSSSSFGAADASRIVAVAITSRASASRPITGVTIGGVAATEISNVTGPDTSGRTNSAVFAAAVPTGTTGDIVVTHSASNARCAVSVYRIIGATLGSSVGASDSSSSTDPTVSIDPPDGSIVIAAAYVIGSATASWTGLDEDVETSAEGTAVHTAASRAFPSAASSHVVTCDFSSTSGPAMAVGIFVP